MTHEEFDQLFEKRVELLRETGRVKGLKYTQGSGDRLANFTKDAETLGLTSLQIWRVYFHKHFTAIQYFLNSGKNIGEDIINTHVHDCIMYLFLLEGLIKEQRKEETQ
jgi:hypothetical protein